MNWQTFSRSRLLVPFPHAVNMCVRIKKVYNFSINLIVYKKNYMNYLRELIYFKIMCIYYIPITYVNKIL